MKFFTKKKILFVIAMVSLSAILASPVFAQPGGQATTFSGESEGGSQYVTDTTTGNTTNRGTCTINSAQFDPSNGTGKAAVEFFKDSVRPAITISIKTSDCENKRIFVSIFESASSTSTSDIIPELNNREFTIPANNELEIRMKAGETYCNSNTDPDCDYWMAIGTVRYQMGAVAADTYISKGKSGGRLAYDCDTTCDESWEYVSSTALNAATYQAVLVDGGSVVAPGSACADTDGKPIAGCYELYGGLSEALGNNFSKIENADSLGALLNAIIAWIIGIGGVLTVVMIMYNGYLYIVERKEGNVSKMGTAKTRIFNSVLGLLLLLTIYTILRTINPDLLNLVPRIDLASLTVDEKIALDTEGYNTDDQKNAPTKNQLKDAVNKYKTKQEYLEKEYIPARDQTLPSATKGLKLFITAHALQEGFYPGSVSYRTNNPGNIGNVDNGGTRTYATLAQGIQAQNTFASAVSTNNERNYKIGARVTKPAVTYNGVTYPAIDFVYNGSLDQYLKIYATGARKSNSYVNTFVNYFKKNGVTITSQTTIAQIVAIQG